jgi:hypothetical protein
MAHDHRRQPSAELLRTPQTRLEVQCLRNKSSSSSWRAIHDYDFTRLELASLRRGWNSHATGSWPLNLSRIVRLGAGPAWEQQLKSENWKPHSVVVSFHPLRSGRCITHGLVLNCSLCWLSSLQNWRAESCNSEIGPLPTAYIRERINSNVNKCGVTNIRRRLYGVEVFTQTILSTMERDRVFCFNGQTWCGALKSVNNVRILHVLFKSLNCYGQKM